jgi:FtsP/CotA-like multicopper oxidase with cupredoxin domain
MVVDEESDTGVVGNQRLEPVEVKADGTKVFELTAAITEWEVEPGKVVEAWTYNGMVPGPWIDLELGDKVQVRLINELPMGTEIHWHGLDTPFEQDGVVPLTQPLVKSGDTYTYEFTATHPAVAMYHPHHHGNLQVVNGMLGAITVGDLGEELPIPEGRTVGGVTLPADIEISQEIPMVLNDSGVIGLTLNGKSFPSTDGYVGDVGDWVAIHYFNEGNQIHPMHQHQFNQLVVAKDGNTLDSPYWVDTLNVAPGERYTVLMQLTEPGIWVWHCHILTHVEREEGVFGMLTAWVVGTPGEDFVLGGTGSAQ